jgi:protein-L-isoaspartate O-methyltransferase
VKRLRASLEFYDAERADFELVLKAIGKVQRASDAAVRDLDWVHEWVCSVGLAPLHPAEEAYADKAELMNASHQGIVQYPIEFARWLRLLADHRIASYLEIGCANGATACLAAAYLHRLNPALRAITVDLMPLFIFHHLVRDLIPLEYRVGVTSYAFRDQPFDAVFIDADHSFYWAWADYQNVGRSARVCGMHDVKSVAYYESHQVGGVTAVWELIKREEGGEGIRFEEIAEHPADVFGIGVRLREGKAEG